jgi:hypothetical protein
MESQWMMELIVQSVLNSFTLGEKHNEGLNFKLTIISVTFEAKRQTKNRGDLCELFSVFR